MKIKWWQKYMDYRGRPMTNEEIAEACTTAADLLEGRWAQGFWYAPAEHTMCIEGALGAALGLNVENMDGDSYVRDTLYVCEVHDAVMETLHQKGPGDWDSLPTWNDKQDRTEQDALDLLRATAKRVLGVPVEDAMRSTP